VTSPNPQAQPVGAGGESQSIPVMDPGDAGQIRAAQSAAEARGRTKPGPAEDRSFEDARNIPSEGGAPGSPWWTQPDTDG
jgi:hypothetical protein